MSLGDDFEGIFYGALLPERGTVSAISKGASGEAVAGIVCVLFTSDRRVFFMDSNNTIRAAHDWEREEVLVQMLSWRDSAAERTTRS